MYSHEPKNYLCPMCKLVRGEDDEINKKEYIVYENDLVIAYISPKWWINNPGHVIVIPKQHIENIYDISDELLSEVFKTAKKMAVAIRKTYGCNGTSLRQHNEPAGNQAIWHLHVHIFPRYDNDHLYENHEKTHWPSHDEKMPYVNKLKDYFSQSSK